MAADTLGGTQGERTPSQSVLSSDNDGFRRTKNDIKKTNQREKHRTKVVYGTKNNSGSRFNGAQRDSIDLFVYHVNHGATVGDLRGYLYDNGVNLSEVRIDITSHEEAQFKSFRLIAPGSIKEKLLSPDFWSVGIRVKEYNVSRKRDPNDRQQQRKPYNYYHGS